jgi:hypothetical protein
MKIPASAGCGYAADERLFDADFDAPSFPVELKKRQAESQLPTKVHRYLYFISLSFSAAFFST